MSMKMTLLEITQDILNDMNSDAVNSINDTIESQSVAQIVKTAYLEMMANRNWPHLKTLQRLDGVSDVTRRTHLKLPVGLREIEALKYNKRRATDSKDKFSDVTFLYPEAFLDTVNTRDENESNVEYQTDASGVQIKIRNDQPPTYWTTFDDEYIVMDSLELAVDTTLQGSKTQIVGYVDPTWTHEDTFVPDLPSEAFPSLLAEAKSTAFVNVKEVANEKAEQKSTRQRRWLARKAWRAHGGIRRPNYGRNQTSGSTKNPLLDKN
jgi:hypothetical protein